MWQGNLLKKTVVKTLSYVCFLFCYFEYHIYIYVCILSPLLIFLKCYKNCKFKILSLFIKIICTDPQEPGFWPVTMNYYWKFWISKNIDQVFGHNFCFAPLIYQKLVLKTFFLSEVIKNLRNIALSGFVR